MMEAGTSLFHSFLSGEKPPIRRRTLGRDQLCSKRYFKARKAYPEASWRPLLRVLSSSR